MEKVVREETEHGKHGYRGNERCTREGREEREREEDGQVFLRDEDWMGVERAYREELGEVLHVVSWLKTELIQMKNDED